MTRGNDLPRAAVGSPSPASGRAAGPLTQACTGWSARVLPGRVTGFLRGCGGAGLAAGSLPRYRTRLRGEGLGGLQARPTRRRRRHPATARGSPFCRRRRGSRPRPSTGGLRAGPEVAAARANSTAPRLAPGSPPWPGLAGLAAGAARPHPRLSVRGRLSARLRQRPGAATTCRTWGTGSGASR